MKLDVESAGLEACGLRLHRRGQVEEGNILGGKQAAGETQIDHRHNGTTTNGTKGTHREPQKGPWKQRAGNKRKVLVGRRKQRQNIVDRMLFVGGGARGDSDGVLHAIT